MLPEIKVYAPSIHVFTFSDNFNSVSETYNNNINRILNISNFKLKKEYLIQNHENEEKIFHLPLIKSDFYADNNNISINKIQLNGNNNPGINIINKNHQDKSVCIYPLKVYERYILGLKIQWLQEKIYSVNDNEYADKYLRSLNKDNDLILPLTNKKEDDEDNIFGQTVLIIIKTVGLKQKNIIDYKTQLKKISDTYLEAFYQKDEIDNPLEIKKQRPRFNRSGNLLGSPIFEYGIFSDLHNNNYRHTLVWFLCEDTGIKSENIFNNCYGKIMKLFLFRAKVVNAYNQSLDYIKNAEEEEKKVQKEIFDLLDPKNKILLKELKEMIDSIQEMQSEGENFDLIKNDLNEIIKEIERKNVIEYQYQDKLNNDQYQDKLKNDLEKSRKSIDRLIQYFQSKKINRIKVQITFLLKIITQKDNSKNIYTLNYQMMECLNTALKYEKLLQNMEQCLAKIIRYTRLYEESMQQIKGIYPQGDISFLQVFSNKASPYFQQDVNAYLTYLKDDSSFIAKAIQVIRTQLDIKLVEVDQKIQSTVLAVGIGSGAASVVASVVGANYAVIKEEEKNKQSLPPEDTLHHYYPNATYLVYLSVGITLSILAGLLAGFIAGVTARILNKQRRH